MLREIRSTLHLAWPVVLFEIGWILMGIVDTIVVGPLGPAAIGAVGTGSTMFFAVMVLGIGLFYSLDTFVAQNFGANRIDECHRWLFSALWLAVCVSIVLLGVGLIGAWSLGFSGISPEVLDLLRPYLAHLMWSAPPLLVFTVLRRYLQAMNIVRSVMVAVVLANLVNLLFNWVFVYGGLGMPAFGVIGSAYATLLARVAMASFLWIVVVRRERRRPTGFHDVPWTWDTSRMWRLLVLGAPAAVQVALEVGVFAFAGGLAGRISPIALAANQIALNIAGFFFMVPLGLASAAAVRVGQAVGREDAVGMRRAGWSALVVSLTCAMLVAALFVMMPEPLLRIFTRDADVLAVGTAVLLVCAVFQPFDGFQAVATGALRGLGDTRSAMVSNLAFHWFVGLPFAYFLCFRRGWGVVGLWAGLASSLVLVGVTLIAVWAWKSRTPFASSPSPLAPGL